MVTIAAAVYAAFQLSRQPGSPPPAGSARLLVPGNPFNPADRFQLMLVLAQPGAGYAEYHVVAGCGTTARHVLLLLAGDARLIHPRSVLSTGLAATARNVYLSYPWFPSPQQVEVFDIPVEHMKCPRGALPTRFGTASAVGGFVRRPFEVSVGSGHALQMPLLGDEASIDTNIPALGGFWAAPLAFTVSAYAGSLPLYDRIDVARPALTGTGGLSWSGQSFIVPSATWTDEASSSRNQFLTLLLGALIGIVGSILVTLILDWTRQRRRSTAGATE
jgi:hypothetical protein